MRISFPHCGLLSSADGIMANQTPDLRPGIIHLLQLLSSAEKQLEYERRVPGISVPIELLSQWFDDRYLPDSKSFRVCFSPTELQALAVFNNHFGDHEKLLPEAREGMNTWLQDETWQAIMREADRAIAVLNPESANRK
jgi:hypothetical protein